MYLKYIRARLCARSASFYLHLPVSPMVECHIPKLDSGDRFWRCEREQPCIWPQASGPSLASISESIRVVPSTLLEMSSKWPY